MLVARKKEIQILVDAMNSEQSEFIAVYGRRRVGKTYLVRETCQEKFTFQHSGLAGGNKKVQLQAFYDSLMRQGRISAEKPNNWLEAFELLRDLVEQSNQEKKVIFLDELSWMDTPRSDLLLSLEAFWNGWASARKDIVLIVCASATSWRLNKVIHNKGGLYNRLTAQIHLRPFSLSDCEQYLQVRGIMLNRHQILEGYMILGGIPYYWSFFKKGMSMNQNIDAMFFAADAPLKDEFDYLYASIFSRPESYISIVTALGKKKAGMSRSEIVASSGLKECGDLTKYLEELEKCDFIRSYTNFGKKKKDTVYQLIDNFTLFYFKFLTERTQDAHYWSNLEMSSKKNAWCGLAFERVCLEHVSQIKRKLGISGVQTEVHAWVCKADQKKGLHGSQIDLVIVRKDQIINVCEMKYAVGEYRFSKKDDEKLQRQLNDFRIGTRTRYALHPTLVTVYGLKDGSYTGSIQTVITAEDLFEKI